MTVWARVYKKFPVKLNVVFSAAEILSNQQNDNGKLCIAFASTPLIFISWFMRFSKNEHFQHTPRICKHPKYGTPKESAPSQPQLISWALNRTECKFKNYGHDIFFLSTHIRYTLDNKPSELPLCRNIISFMEHLL